MRYNGGVNLKKRITLQDVSHAMMRGWFAVGKLSVPAQRIGGLILVGESQEPVGMTAYAGEAP